MGVAFTALPARLLPLILDSEQVRLGGLSGTVLHGSAARALVRTSAGFVHLGRLTWDVETLSIFSLAPAAKLRSEWGEQRVEARVQRRGDTLLVNELQAAFDASLLRTIAPLAVDGRLSVQLDRLEVTGARLVEAQGRLTWEDALWRTNSRQHVLGSYVAEISSSDEAILAVVDTMRGPVVALGTARLDGRRYNLELDIGTTDGAFAPEIERALRLFATPEEDGYLLRLDGDLAVGP